MAWRNQITIDYDNFISYSVVFIALFMFKQKLFSVILNVLKKIGVKNYLGFIQLNQIGLLLRATVQLVQAIEFLL